MPIRAHLPEGKKHETGDDKEQRPENSEQVTPDRPAPWLKPWQFKPGQSGNPGGRPKRDVSAEIARAIFENNPEAVYNALAGRLTKGDPYAFQQLAERAYGKLKEKIEHSTNDSVMTALLAGRKRAAERKK